VVVVVVEVDVVVLDVVVGFGSVVDVVVEVVVVELDVVVVVSSVDDDSAGGGASLLGELLTCCAGGSGNWSFGTSVNAADMKLCQMVAGSVPPVTVTPCTSFIGLDPSGYPIHTTAA